MDIVNGPSEHHAEEVARLRSRVAALEAALAESEARFHVMAEDAPVLLWMAGPDGRCTYFNGSWLRYTGRTLEQELGYGWAEGVHPADHERCLQTYQDALARGEPFEMEYRLRRRDGQYGWVLDRGFPRRRPDGHLAGYVGSAIDISDHKQATAALQASEEQLRLLMTGITDYAVFMLDPQGRIISWNEGAERTTGYQADEILGEPVERLYLAAEAAQGKAERDLHRALEQGRFEEEGWRVRKDGTRFWGHTVIAPVWDETGRLRGFSRVLHDVSERKEADERLRLALEAGNMGIWDWNVETGEIIWSNNLSEIHGLAPGSFPGTYEAFIQLIYPEDRLRVQRDILRAVETGQDLHIEFRLRWPDGSLHWISGEGRSLRDSSGQTLRVLGVGRDITARKREEELLYQREQEAKALIENAPDIIARFDRQGRHLYVNQAIEAATGLPAESVIGKTNADLGMPEHLNQFWTAEIERVFETGEEQSIEFAFPAPGGTHWFASRIVPERGQNGRVTSVLGITRDITERKQAEERMQFLAEASALLAGSLDEQTTLQRIAKLVVSRLADWCIIHMLGEDGQLEQQAVTHVDPACLDQAHEMRRKYPLGADIPYSPSYAVRTGQSQFVPHITEALLASVARDAEHLQALRGLGLASYMCVPLKAHERVLGTITCIMAGSGRHYGAVDLALAEELGRRAALAVENAQLYKAERQARWEAERAASRTTRLQAISAALANVMAAERVVELVVEQSVEALRARAGTVALLSADEMTLEVIRAVGYPAPILMPYRRFPLAAPLPLAEAVRTGQPVWIDGWSELIRRYPMLEDTQTSNQTWAAVPLVAEGRALGAIGLSFGERQRITIEDRELILAIARLGAQALQRARLYEAEQQARAEAQTSEQRLAFLAEASNVLASSLDYQHTLQAVAHLVVPRLADWCLLDIREGDDYQRLAVVHRDPARAHLAAQLQRYPPDLDAPGGSGHVLRTGEPEFHTQLSDAAALAAARKNPELLAILRQMGFASYVIVPLIARDRILGALSLVAGEAGRRYGPGDLALAQELARRAALAIDNARLYREAQEAIREREGFVATASHELRTPLTTVKVYTSLLTSHLAQADWEYERIARFSRQLQDQVARLEALVVDLLDAARVQQGRLELRPALTDLRQLAEQVLTRFEENPERRAGHALVFDAPEPVRGLWDASRLDQVITNLVSNALKYSPDGGEVRVRIRYADDMAELTVSDQGIGIPVEEQARLFRPFARGEMALRGITGVGLGLYITAQIIELHGGTVSLKSQPGAGSTFTIRLPLHPPPAPAAANSPHPD